VCSFCSDRNVFFSLPDVRLFRHRRLRWSGVHVAWHPVSRELFNGLLLYNYYVLDVNYHRVVWHYVRYYSGRGKNNIIVFTANRRTVPGETARRGPNLTRLRLNPLSRFRLIWLDSNTIKKIYIYTLSSHRIILWENPLGHRIMHRER